MGYPNTTFSNTPQPKNMSMVPTSSGMNSSNASMVPQSGLGAFNSTKTTSANGGSSTKPLSIPSVLAQQQALNKQGAGLVEDGIAGPKTEAAIAKYGTGSTSSSTSTGNTSNSSSQTDTNSADKYNIYTGALNSNYVDPNAPANTNYNSSNPATFPGLINRGATASGNAANTGATNYDTANTGLLNATAGNQQYQDNAANIANAAGQQISNIGQEGARGEAGYLTTGTSPVGEGNSAVLAQTTAAQQQAVSQGANMQLAGNAQGLTGQLQQEQGYNQASGNALTSQGQGITGLNSAADNAKSYPTSQGQTTYNPMTNSFSGGSYATNLQTVVQAIKSGNMGYTDGVNSLASLSPTAKADVLAALGTGFDTVASDANASAKGSNITTGGTAATSAAASGLQSATNNYVAANTAYSTATAQSKNLQSTMTSTGINTNPQFVNSKINALQNQLGSANYASFITSLNEARQAYTNLLSSVGASTPTVNGQQATDIFNQNSTPAQINAAIDALNQAAYAKLKPMYDQIGIYQSQLGGSGTGTTGTGAGSSWDNLPI